MRPRLSLTQHQKFFGLLLHDQSLFSRYFFSDELTKPLSTRQKLVANDLSERIVLATGRKVAKTIINIEGRILRNSIQQQGKISERMLVTAGEKQLDPLRDRIMTRIGRNPLFKMLLIEANKNAGIMRFAGGCIWYLRIEGTSGSDANMVGLRAEEIIMDEAQLGNFVCHNSRLQTALPGCKFMYAGVPDGRRDSMFYKLDQTMMGKGWSHHKTSTYINPLYWSIEERDKLRNAYGGVNSPDYITQVLGQWGKSMLSVFPVESMAIHHNAYRFVRMAGKDIPNEIGDAMDRLKLAARLQIPRITADVIILGMDYGNKQDPTEIFLAYQTSVPGDWVQFMRIQVLGADDVQQAFLLQYLIEILGPNKMGKMCIDLASCGVGPVLRRITPNKQFWAERLIDYNAGGKVMLIQEVQVPDGAEPNQSHKHPIGRKEWATRILQSAMIAARNNVEPGTVVWIPNDETKQIRRANNPRLWLADDEEVIQELLATRSRKTESGYTVYLPPSKGPRNPIDHCTDAARTLALAALETQRMSEDVDDEPAVAMTNTPLFGIHTPASRAVPTPLARE